MDSQNQQISLPDGRTLGYAEIGDPEGFPVMFFHGQPGNRLFQPDADITRQTGIRLILPDRPGYGLSSDQPDRKILDWPKDIMTLSETLGLPRFGVIGYSAGGPYALACAAVMPERLSQVMLISGAPPVTDKHLRKSMPLLIRLNYFLVHYSPNFFDWVFRSYWRTARKNPHQFIKMATKNVAPTDKVVADSPAYLDMLLDTWKENLRRSHQGYVKDATLLMQDWGYDLTHIEKEILLWWGEEDRNNPISSLQFFENHLKHSHTFLHPLEGHFNFLSRWDQVLELFKPDKTD